ncbi:hypothetical protein QFZ66_004441 [Streptomyces sp. B4I13]|uniref:hypothetical protein n=1 Tax=Streptomyces sp. B4I13 TaxID=3042271 RepID=UPI002786B77A|nr:hypothetical protein [Streptomyces sp. B4I13]MDQ0960563.1 hypothetical protein [Streptomyces sp. B4I13]
MRTPAAGAVALAGVLLLLPGGGAAYAAAPAHSVAPRSAGPSASTASTASPSSPSSREPDRAGSRAGEGRQRPGRAPDEAEAADDASGVGALPDEPEEASDGDAEAGDGDPDDTASASAEAAVPATPAAPRDDVRQAAAQGERADGPVLQILPLGSGLVLIGLGIALALAALRLRRG